MCKIDRNLCATNGLRSIDKRGTRFSHCQRHISNGEHKDWIIQWVHELIYFSLCSNCWDKISLTCRVFTRLFTLNTPGTFSSILLYSYWLKRKMIQIFYEYNTENTTKHSATCYDEDINRKTWLRFNSSIVCQVSWPNGYGSGFTIQRSWVQDPLSERRIFHFVNLASAPCRSRKRMEIKLTMICT